MQQGRKRPLVVFVLTSRERDFILILTSDNVICELSEAEQAIIADLRRDMNEAVDHFERHRLRLPMIRKTRFIFSVCASKIEQTKAHRQSHINVTTDRDGLELLNAAIRHYAPLLRDIEIGVATHEITQPPTLQFVVVISGSMPEVG